MDERMKILIVEDDDGISDFVNLELLHEGYDTNIAKSGREALRLFEEFKPDMILLDVMLPELNGIEVLRRIRSNSNVPVILVTARTETFDRVNGLNTGADDYITKPFEIEELLARINAVMRRYSNGIDKSVHLFNRDLDMDVGGMKVFLKGDELSLSKIEYMMLKLFLENQEKVLSRDNIISCVWGENHYIDENTVDVYVGYLRAKIDAVCDEQYIKTVRGFGYKMIGE